MKLTKTEAALLAELETKERVSAEWLYGRGPEGGRFAEGYRKWAACNTLVNKGLVKLVRKDDSRNHLNNCNNHIIVIAK